MTGKGRALFDAMIADHARWVDEALGAVAPEEKEQLIDLLIRVRRAFETKQSGDGTSEGEDE